jgi:hypothetical protein
MSVEWERPSGREPVTATLNADEEATGPFVPVSGRGFNVTISGTFVGTLKLERSFDDGVTYHPCTDNGTAITYTAPASEVILEPEHSVTYRLRMDAYTSGDAVVRISQ